VADPIPHSQPSTAQIPGSSRVIAESAQPSDPSEEASDDNPYGLEILHLPKTALAKPVQIIFVHGLGGSKKGTWTHSKTKFWPAWLHDEKGFENVRIVLFGYNANFNVLAPNTNLSIPIFANQLLYEMNRLGDTHGPVLTCL
jgi:hypothetical protein